jgi:hypothetical protein
MYAFLFVQFEIFHFNFSIEIILKSYISLIYVYKSILNVIFARLDHTANVKGLYNINLRTYPP